MEQARAWQEQLEGAQRAIERWDVAGARASAEKARALAAAWGDAQGVALAEVLAHRAALLTSTSPGELVIETQPSANPMANRVLTAARVRLEVEAAIALDATNDLPSSVALAEEPLMDEVAAAALTAVARIADLSRPLSRVPGSSRVKGWPEPHGWRYLIESVEAEAHGRSGIATVELALAAAESVESRALRWTALKLRRALCLRRGADGEARATRDRMRELLEAWALELPAADAAVALLRPDRTFVSSPPSVRGVEAARGPASSAILVGLALALAGERSIERLIDLALDAAISVTHAERGVLLLAEGDGYRVGASRHVDSLTEGQGLIGLSSTVAHHALKSREVVESSDVRQDPRFKECASLNVVVTSILCVPILARAELEGAIYLDRTRQGVSFDAEAVAAARAIGSMLAAALLNARVIADLESRTRELDAAREELNVLLATRTVERDDMSRRLAAAQNVVPGPGGLVGSGPPMVRLRRSIERVAGSDAPVLITGETGSGKELVARSIHGSGRRRDQPFVAINCGALSETLLEAELFGSERGAYTGASSSRPGLFVAADGGTLLLDEVGDMPPAMQTALLRVLETSEIRAVGSTKSRAVDVRILAATHHDLLSLVRKGAFRDDLRYRLEVVRLEVPPLRERLEDMAELCQHLLEDARRRYSLPERRLAPAALAALGQRGWPGNVRELRHVLASAALASEGPLIVPNDLPAERAARASEPPAPELFDLGGPDGHATRVEAIRRSLKATAGHRGRAAELLGVSRSTLYRYLEIYEIDLAEFEASRRSQDES